MDKLIEIIVELQYIYYYYPCKNEKNSTYNGKTFFYMNYFKSYHLDYPSITLIEMLDFFVSNATLCEEVLFDTNFMESFELMLYLLQLEERLKQEKFSLKFLFDKNIKRIINSEGMWLLYPLSVVKKICCRKKIDFETFRKKYMFDLETNNNPKNNLLDIVVNSKDKRFMFITSKFLFFPRDYYCMYKMYDMIWRSTSISKKTDDGKTVKSLMHENTVFRLLKEYFGENNVYTNVYLKREGRQYAEKDFVVFYQNKILSFEAKSNLLPKPELEDSIDDIKRKCEECIRKAYAQGLEVKRRVMDGTAIFYDNSKKKNNVVLDLSNTKVDECLQIIVMYEEYLGIETNIECIYPEFDAWIIDVKNLKFILSDTVGRGNFEEFVTYAQKRKNVYGLVSVPSGEELKVYNLYKHMPIFFEGDAKDKGIRIQI